MRRVLLGVHKRRCAITRNSFIIYSRIYKVHLQETYSEASPVQPRRYKLVLNKLLNAFALFLGRRRTSKGIPFQVEGATMERARRCLVAIVARGTKS